ncbi:MAG: hypothetical protein LiPW16_524, partial [Microgenomates group bacterium LiPW_16]
MAAPALLPSFYFFFLAFNVEA